MRLVEVKRNEKTRKILNMIPISPERVRIVFNKSGMIKRYDVWNSSEWKEVKTKNMLHISNKRVGDQLHGTSQILPSKKTIKAMNEALEDEKTIKHRDKALGIVYYKTNNAGKITYANSQNRKSSKERRDGWTPRRHS